MYWDKAYYYMFIKCLTFSLCYGNHFKNEYNWCYLKFLFTCRLTNLIGDTSIIRRISSKYTKLSKAARYQN